MVYCVIDIDFLSVGTFYDNIFSINICSNRNFKKKLFLKKSDRPALNLSASYTNKDFFVDLRWSGGMI